jgi:hypothetical protein
MEVTLRLEANHTTALHTAIAAKENPSFKLIEIGPDKSMPPEAAALTTRADFRPGPRVIPTLFINFLENSNNNQYHCFTFWGTSRTRVLLHGRRAPRKLSDLFSIKKASSRRPIYFDNLSVLVNLF